MTVNAVCPGYTDTDIVKDAIANIRAKTGRSESEALAALVATNPQRRLIQPRRSRRHGALAVQAGHRERHRPEHRDRRRRGDVMAIQWRRTRLPENSPIRPSMRKRACTTIIISRCDCGCGC